MLLSSPKEKVDLNYSVSYINSCLSNKLIIRSYNNYDIGPLHLYQNSREIDEWSSNDFVI